MYNCDYLPEIVQYERGQRGAKKLIYCGHAYVCAKVKKLRKYWICAKQRSKNCKARIVTNLDESQFSMRNMTHTHPKSEKYINY